MKKNISYFIVLIAIINFSNCKKFEFNGSSSLLKTGDYHKDGIIGYLLKEGDLGFDINKQHGLIYDIFSSSNSIKWGGAKITNANGSILGTGNSNSIIIESKNIGLSGGDCAAIYCNHIGDGSSLGFSDWYLPSIGELILITIVEKKTYYFWSSTEKDSVNAWCCIKGPGNYSELKIISKQSLLYDVLAVRSF